MINKKKKQKIIKECQICPLLDRVDTGDSGVNLWKCRKCGKLHPSAEAVPHLHEWRCGIDVGEEYTHYSFVCMKCAEVRGFNTKVNVIEWENSDRIGFCHKCFFTHHGKRFCHLPDEACDKSCKHV